MSIIKYEELKKRIIEIEFVFKKIKETRAHLEVVFVFGKAGENPSNSHRAKFLEYARGQKSPFNFLTIERLYDDLKKFANRTGVSAKRTDLVHLELRAIKQAHSLIVFPESVGSYAELGYFTAIKDTQVKMYIANHYGFHSENSYLNHLIHVVHNNRDLRPLIYDWDNPNPEKYFQKILDNLSSNYEFNQHTRNFKNSELFPLAILYELIRIFPYLSFKQLEYSTKHILELYRENSFDLEGFTVNISMLVVTELIKRVEQEEKTYFIPTNKEYELVKFDLNEKEYIKFFELNLQYNQDTQRMSNE
jgi:hypothetical protein